MALYLEHFGLKEPPFRITPHTDFFFDGADRGATLEGLMYAIVHDEGIVKVSGEIGSGKTTLCRVLMERLPAEVETVFLANPSYSRAEILQAIAEELGRAPAEGAASGALRDLQARLIETYAAGRRVVVLIDEAHAMPEETLEQVRLLSNLESNRLKLLQIVLFGQPELDDALAKPSMRQLKDRITHSFRTRPLAADEVAKYVAFRLRAAGHRGGEVFSREALAAITRASSGLTRRINVLCDKALLAAFAGDSTSVTKGHVRAAIADSEFAATAPASRRGLRALAALALVALGAAAAGAVFWFLREPVARPPVAQPSPPKKPAPAAAPTPPVATPTPPVPQGPASAAPTGAATPLRDAQAAPAVEKAKAPLAEAQLRRFDGYAPGQNRLLRDRLAATRATLLSAPDASCGIELFFTENSDPGRTERFLARARVLVSLENVFVIPVSAGARYFLRVVYGAYPDRAACADAARRLPPKYQQSFVFTLRSFAELRAAI
ncbi:MAG TPA: AAA family ATPase [Burkholderiales bacterium]|nr:AAA family ATPase [Burkholderiales bacterium]